MRNSKVMFLHGIIFGLIVERIYGDKNFFEIKHNIDLQHSVIEILKNILLTSCLVRCSRTPGCIKAGYKNVESRNYLVDCCLFKNLSATQQYDKTTNEEDTPWATVTPVCG